MRKFIFLILMLLYSVNINKGASDKINVFRLSDDVLFLLALSKVESNFNFKAYNHKEEAHGILQIRPVAIKCVNDYYKTNFTIADCYTDKAFTIAMLYLNKWGKALSYYDKARIWNGGAMGYKKQSTINYANRVMYHMSNMKKFKTYERNAILTQNQKLP